MATIKLQPSGAVVIKDGKVACACCSANCGCLTTIPSSIRNLVQNATASSFTLNGLPPDSFTRNSPTSWVSIITGENGAEGYYWETGYIDGCLGFFLVGSFDNSSTLAEPGTEELLCGANQNPTYGKFTINGDNNFDCFFLGDGTPLPPVYIFT
jgi:hypothetical protein